MREENLFVFTSEEQHLRHRVGTNKCPLNVDCLVLAQTVHSAKPARKKLVSTLVQLYMEKNILKNSYCFGMIIFLHAWQN